MLEVVLSHRFKRDLRVAKRRGCPLDKLEEVVNTLAQQLPLAEKYRDHSPLENIKGFGSVILNLTGCSFTAWKKQRWRCFYFAPGHTQIYFEGNRMTEIKKSPRNLFPRAFPVVIFR